MKTIIIALVFSFNQNAAVLPKETRVPGVKVNFKRNRFHK